MLRTKYMHLIAGTPCEQTADRRFELIRGLEKETSIDSLFTL